MGTQHQVEDVILSILRELNHAVDSLLDLVSAWTSKDFDGALDQANQILQHLNSTRKAIQLASDDVVAKRASYLEELEEVETLVHSFHPFLAEKNAEWA